jgi:xylitol oxidase
MFSRGPDETPRGGIVSMAVTLTHAPLSNWSHSHRYRATALERPQSLNELRMLLAHHSGSVQVLATRHTFTAMGDADTLIALDRLPGGDAIDIDRVAMTATVGPTVTYAQLAEALNAAGLALGNLASLPHISVTGAIATATHGSGDGQGNLATAVRELALLTADGDLVTLTPEDPRFPGAVVHLGALGVVTRVTLQCIPGYSLRQDMYLNLEWGALEDHFDAVTSAGYSVSVFHDFGERARELLIKGDAGAPVTDERFGARAAHEPRNPVPGASTENITEQLGLPGPWSERLPHFRSGFTPSSGAEIQSEFFVDRGDATAALAALRPLAATIQPVLRIAELRTVAADELWMSPQYRRDCAGLHFTWRLEPEAVRAACASVEAILAQFSPHPHWGKFYTTTPPALPLQDRWWALRDELDPRGVFANRWLRELQRGR